MTYDEAVAELYRAPHGDFVNERKRLAGELKTAGDKAGATRLGKLARPPISAWTVNQLWWQAREAFDALFESAAKLRGGDLGAQTEHRDAHARLRQRAQTILGEAGHAATESTLRRVATTLSALAATGGFDPDPDGALSADRDPPGFEAVGVVPIAAAPREEKSKEADAAKQELEAAAAERRKKEQAEAKRLAEVRAAESAVSGAKSELERKQKDLDRLRKAMEAAEAGVEKSQAALDEAEAALAALQGD